MKILNCLMVVAAFIFSSISAAQCPVRIADLIESEASAAGIPAVYLLAIAETATNCDPAFSAGSRRGLMAIRVDLLPARLQRDREWLFYPSVNVRAAATVLESLLQQHGDWETVLRVYVSRDSDGDPASNRRVQNIFAAAHRTGCTGGPAIRRPPLDDFEDCRSPLSSDWSCRTHCGSAGCWRTDRSWPHRAEAGHPVGECR